MARGMELRKDPITRSWVMIGHREEPQVPVDPCPLCAAGADTPKHILRLPAQGPWQVCVFPHMDPFYRIEGEIGRSADGIYDRMRPVGAHEIVLESPEHSRQFTQFGDEEIERVMQAFSQRIIDLKKDARFKYVTVFKNCGVQAGEEWPHNHAQITATTFVPRRILYELRAARDYFQQKERCVFCDIVRQEEKKGVRVVDSQGDYVAFCPYASRVPYETWLMSRKHNHAFEQPRPSSNRRNLAAVLGRMIRRLQNISHDYHLVLHTSPNTLQTKGELSAYWSSIADDYHWHIEVLPILARRSKSYSFKEVYFNSLPPEDAAEQLRKVNPNP
jgi:UDPglucose--hexose-1-phosphate uridylyltransferase